MKKKILITGGHGHLGSEIYKILNKKFICRKVDRHLLKKKNNLKFYDYVKKISPNIIINCAAIVGLKLAESNKKLTKEINSDLPKNLAIFSRKLKIHLIHISTHSVFDGYRSKISFNEDIKPKPMSFYGKTKYLGEKNIILKSQIYTILRLPYLFSNNLKFNSNVLKKIFNDINKGSITITKKEVSSLASTDKVAKAINDIIINKSIGIYHYADQGFFNWLYLINYISKKMNKRLIIRKKIEKLKKTFNTSLSSNFTFYGYSNWQYNIDKIIKKTNNLKK
tara:strand:- start:17083 stop:17922 length:840 start_codon:yes stop_codon:yes gene_type:complete